MKIKVYPTKAELLEVLSSHFGHTVIDVEIETKPTMAKIIRDAVTKFAYQAGEKIAAIKALRQLVSENNWVSDVLGLGDAKWAIENFNEFITFVEKNERLPEPGYSEGLK